MFILFHYSSHYPSGGAYDAVGVFASADEAKEAYKGDHEYAHIARVDASELVVIAEGWATNAGSKTYPRSIRWEDSR